MVFPEPVISMAVEPKTKSDQEKMGMALGRLAQEDPSFRVHTDEESGQTIIAGMGELHLDILVDRMKREFHVEANVGKPQVAYRETIRKAVKAEGKFVRQSGGKGQFGHVWLEISPNEQGTDRTSTRLNSSHQCETRMPSSACKKKKTQKTARHLKAKHTPKRRNKHKAHHHNCNLFIRVQDSIYCTEQSKINDTLTHRTSRHHNHDRNKHYEHYINYVT